MEVTKEFSWAMTHRLENHNGLCKNVHGHGYKLFVTIKKIKSNQKVDKTNVGMVMDFKDLKNIVNKNVIDLVDHAFMYNVNDKESKDIAEFLHKKIDQKLCPMDCRTTAENMAEWIYNMLFKSLVNYGCICTKIKLYETDTSYAEFEGEYDE